MTYAVLSKHVSEHGLVSMKSSADSEISAEYGKTPKYACYLLLAVTALLRNYQWLAAGAAASVMTYSGVAAIHLIVLFATNDRLNEPSSKARCEQVVLPGTDTTFLACAGIYDPDLGVIFNVINNSLVRCRLRRGPLRSEAQIANQSSSCGCSCWLSATSSTTSLAQTSIAISKSAQRIRWRS